MKYLKLLFGSLLMAIIPVMVIFILGGEHDYVKKSFGGVPVGTLLILCAVVFIVSFVTFFCMVKSFEKRQKERKSE